MIMSDNKREKFIELVINVAKKNKSPYLLSESDYGNTLAELHAALVKTTRKTDHEYRLLNRYSIVKMDDIEKIIEKRKSPDDSVRYVVPIEQVSASLTVLLYKRFGICIIDARRVGTSTTVGQMGHNQDFENHEFRILKTSSENLRGIN